jgi:hypothetical protein
MNSQVSITPPQVGSEDLAKLEQRLTEETLQAVDQAAQTWIKRKKNNEKVVVATGSGPNVHEGVTTLLAELVRLDLVDGILTSSAVVGHEMAGALEKVRRVDGVLMGYPAEVLPTDGKVEAALAPEQDLVMMQKYVPLDMELYQRYLEAPGNEITKVAGNLAYPTGYFIEKIARHLEVKARAKGVALEETAGLAADPRTMLGACARKGRPCLVTVPQLIGSGQVGLSIGDSICLTSRCAKIAHTLSEAGLIIESGVALTQEIHDGPFELFTGHGHWSREMGLKTYSLAEKSLVRIDLDPALKQVWEKERQSQDVGEAIDKGKPKAVSMGVPFRMEMSGFARLPGSQPVLGDLGVVWPLLANRVAKGLGVRLGFSSYKQGTELGEAIRAYIVDQIRPLNPELG